MAKKKGRRKHGKAPIGETLKYRQVSAPLIRAYDDRDNKAAAVRFIENAIRSSIASDVVERRYRRP